MTTAPTPRRRQSKEHSEQTRFVMKVRAFHPAVLCFAVPNGASVSAAQRLRLTHEGMMSGAPDLMLLRPLLSWRRTELQAVLDLAGMTAADDPSNRDATYERVRTRDALTSNKAFDAKGFASSAQYLAEADDALEWVVTKLWSEVAQTSEALIWSPPADMPDTLGRRVLERILSKLDAPVPRGPDLARWLERLRSGGVATLGGVKGDARKGPWRFTLAPKPRHQGTSALKAGR